MGKVAKNLVSITKAAKYLGVSVATLRRWHNEGTFKATFVSPGGHRYYALSDLGRKTKGIFRVAQEWVSAEKSYPPEHDFYCSTSDRFKTRYERMAHELDANPALQGIASLISSSVGEIGNNSFDHNLGNWPDLPGVFFAHDPGKRVVVLADRGVGVFATLHRIRPGLKTDEEALRVAFTEFITGRAPEHRGNGLKYVKDALAKSEADLTFQSGDAVLEIRKGKPGFLMKKADVPIRGSLAFIQY